MRLERLIVAINLKDLLLIANRVVYRIKPAVGDPIVELGLRAVLFRLCVWRTLTTLSVYHVEILGGPQLLYVFFQRTSLTMESYYRLQRVERR